MDSALCNMLSVIPLAILGCCLGLSLAFSPLRPAYTPYAAKHKCQAAQTPHVHLLLLHSLGFRPQTLHVHHAASTTSGSNSEEFAGELPGLWAALDRKRLDRDMLRALTKLVLAEKEREVSKVLAEKELEMSKVRAEKDLEIEKAWGDARVATAEARAAQSDARAGKAQLETATLRLRAKNLEILRLVHGVTLRGAIVSFQEDEVLPLLGLKPKTPLTYELWEKFLDLKPDIRKRVERQTSWRMSTTAIKISHISRTLSGQIHAAPQQGNAAVVLSAGILTEEECLGVGALLFDYVPFYFDPPKLMEEFEKNEGVAK